MAKRFTEIFVSFPTFGRFWSSAYLRAAPSQTFCHHGQFDQSAAPVVRKPGVRACRAGTIPADCVSGPSGAFAGRLWLSSILEGARGALGKGSAGALCIFSAAPV